MGEILGESLILMAHIPFPEAGEWSQCHSTLGECTRAWKTIWVPGKVKAEVTLMPLNTEEPVREEAESPPRSPSE